MASLHRPTFQVKDITLRFPWDSVTGRIGLEIFPTSLVNQLVVRRETLRGLPYIDAIPDVGDAPAYHIDSLVQIKIVGDSYPGAFAQGHTMRNSPSIDAFRFIGQTVFQENDRGFILITLESAHCHRIEHRISWHEGDAAFLVATTFFNDSELPVTLEMLSSLAPEQWKIIRRAQGLYQQAALLIKKGTSRRFGSLGESWRYPEGWQAVVRTQTTGKTALVVIHAFAKSPARMEIPLPPGGGWKIDEQFCDEAVVVSIVESKIVHHRSDDFSAAVLLMSCD